MAAKGVSGAELYQPHTSFDLLRVPGLGRLLRWRWGRLVLQLPLLALALLVIYDGLTGPQLAPQNIATVSVWVHYRGLVMLALLLVGNLFCMGCPFTLPRTLARKLSSRGRRWPQALRNKWLAIGVFVGYLWLYEALDLWASPALTAWLVIGYFGAAFLLEAIFAESPFCKYVCPLGTFNFTASTVSPLQITARRVEVCRTCVGKECVNGSAQTLGCGTELFVPQIRSNLNCTFCLDCARACPHDNVALAARKPLSEFIPLSVKPSAPGSAAARPAGVAWPRRWDVAFLALVFAFAGLANAFGMTPPVYTLAAALSRALGTKSEALIFGVLMLLLPAALGLGAAWLSRRLGAGQGGRANQGSLRVVFARYAPTVAPLAFAIWFAHYWFHFASGALAIVPVIQSFLIDHGITLPSVGFGTFLLNQPNWALGAIMSDDAVFLLVLAAVATGYLASLVSLSRTARTEGGASARRAMLPWLALWTGLALAALLIFSLPMEMRGMIG
jgi:ferredoxin